MRGLLASLLCALALSAHSANVAFVADVRGAATIEGNGRVEFLSQLAPGTRLLLGTGAMVVITFATSGSEYTLAGPGEFSIGSSDVRAGRGAAPVRRTVVTLPDPGVVTRVSQAATASVRMRGIGSPPRAPRGDLGEASFETLPAEAVARAERARIGARTFADRVIHALLLHDIGATHDARRAWAALALERPDLPALDALAR